MLLEVMKAPAIQTIAGNAGANTDTPVTTGMLQSILYELFGAGQWPGSGSAPIGSTFPPGAVSTGTVPMFIDVDTVSLSSPAGGTPALKSFALPAGALFTNGPRGVRVRGSGSFANNAAAKTVVLKFGATTILTVTATASVANLWHVDATVWARTATTQLVQGFGAQGTGTPTFVVGDTTAAETLANAITIAFSGTQTSAADIVQDMMTVEIIP